MVLDIMDGCYDVQLSARLGAGGGSEMATSVGDHGSVLAERYEGSSSDRPESIFGNHHRLRHVLPSSAPQRSTMTDPQMLINIRRLSKFTRMLRS